MISLSEQEKKILSDASLNHLIPTLESETSTPQQIQAFNDAIVERDDELFELLLKHAVDIDRNQGILTRLAGRNNADYLQQLLESGKYTLTRQRVQEAFFEACSQGSYHVLNILLEIKLPGLDLLLSRNERQQSGLMLASRMGHCDIVDRLIQIHTDNNDTEKLAEMALLRDSEEQTALMIACRYAQFDVVTRLLALNIPNMALLIDKYGQTALMLACQHQDDSPASFGCVDYILSQTGGTAAYVQDYKSYTPLMLACLYNNVPVVERLLGLNVDINLINQHDDSALMIACRQNEAFYFHHKADNVIGQRLIFIKPYDENDTRVIELLLNNLLMDEIDDNQLIDIAGTNRIALIELLARRRGATDEQMPLSLASSPLSSSSSSSSSSLSISPPTSPFIYYSPYTHLFSTGHIRPRDEEDANNDEENPSKRHRSP